MFSNPSFGSDVATTHGAVHVFRRDDALGWTAAGKLVAPDGVVLDWFGGTLDVSGDHLAVGAYRTNDMAVRTRWGGFADPDGDSLDNAAEYLAGSDPLGADPFEPAPPRDSPPAI